MKVSIAIPVLNEEKTVGELLSRLLEQTRPPDEIVLTDGGSQDRTTEIIANFIDRYKAVKLITVDQALPGRGRNLAAAEANNEWLAFIDAGIEPATNWLDALVSKAEQDSTVDVVYGMWEPITDTFFAECAAIAFVPPPTISDGVVARPRSIASSLFKRSVWRSVGGFPENLRSAEDLLFMNRVQEAGFKTVFEPTAIVSWRLSPTFGATFKRFVVYARNNIRAGLWRQWQAPIFTRYALIVALTLFLLAVSSKLIWLPLVLWLLMLSARSMVAIYRNRNCYPASPIRNFKRLLVLVPLLATLDAAALVGSIHWLISDSFRPRGKTAVEAGNGA